MVSGVSGRAHSEYLGGGVNGVRNYGSAGFAETGAGDEASGLFVQCQQGNEGDKLKGVMTHFILRDIKTTVRTKNIFLIKFSR